MTTFEQDIACVAERLRETYDQEGVDIVLAHVRKVQREAADLRGRIDRTVAYLRQVSPFTKSASSAADVIDATIAGLTTPIADPEPSS